MISHTQIPFLLLAKESPGGSYRLHAVYEPPEDRESFGHFYRDTQSFQYSGTSFPPTFGVYKVCAQDERSLAHEERFTCPGLNVVLVSRSLFCFNVGLGFVKWPCDFSCQSPVSS